jgi:hypothetical protein
VVEEMARRLSMAHGESSPQDDIATELGTDRELRRAFTVLHNALIRTRGGGRFADSSATIILARETARHRRLPR